MARMDATMEDRRMERARGDLRMVAALAALALTAPGQALERELEAVVDASDLERIWVDASVGTMEVEISPDDNIYVTVMLEPQDDVRWGRRDDVERSIEEAVLEQETTRGRASFSIDYPRHSDEDDDVEEHWTVLVPAALNGRFRLNVGSMDVRGITGGVDATVNVGELDIDVPRGDVDASVNVGDLDIFNETGSVGRVDLDADVGDARLSVDGRRIHGDQGWVGERIRYDGEGEDDIEGSVNVGDISARVGDG